MDPPDGDALISAVRQLKLDDPSSTAKVIHEKLISSGMTCEFSQVKKVCNKVAKALAQEEPIVTSTPATAATATATAPTTARKERKAARAGVPLVADISKLPCLVRPASAVAFVCCQLCGTPVADVEALVCGGCRCVCYCSQRCQAADTGHANECDAYARHMATDVSLSLGSHAPAWLGETMNHRCDTSYCTLLERCGVHNELYGVLCGCTLPSSPHRYLIDPGFKVADDPEEPLPP